MTRDTVAGLSAAALCEGWTCPLGGGRFLSVAGLLLNSRALNTYFTGAGVAFALPVLVVLLRVPFVAGFPGGVELGFPGFGFIQAPARQGAHAAFAPIGHEQ